LFAVLVLASLTASAATQGGAHENGAKDGARAGKDLS
jgi:hypothetical protein